jgi:hypothetical protein
VSEFRSDSEAFHLVSAVIDVRAAVRIADDQGRKLEMHRPQFACGPERLG